MLTDKRLMAANTVQLFKFPRTKHLFDAGGSGVSRDNLLMDAGEEKRFYSPPGKGPQQLVAIEEKVDGANLGISIDTDMKLCVKNRSHFINSKTHKQFSTLDACLACGELLFPLPNFRTRPACSL